MWRLGLCPRNRVGVARGGLGPQRQWKKSHNHFSCAKGTNIYVKVLCSVIVNVTKYVPQKCQIWQICGYQVCFFQSLNTPKLVFRQGSALDPAGELTTLPRPPSRLGGTPPPIPFHPRRLRHLDLGAFGVSISVPHLSAPQHKFLAMPMTT